MWLQIHPLGGDHAPGADADWRALRGVRARRLRRRGGQVHARRRRRRHGQHVLLPAAVQPAAAVARRLRGQGLLRAPPAQRHLAGLRRRARQAHLQRGVRGPPFRRAQTPLRRHAVPSILRQKRGRLVTRRVGSARGLSSDRPTVAIERYRLNGRYHCKRLDIYMIGMAIRRGNGSFHCAFS